MERRNALFLLGLAPIAYSMQKLANLDQMTAGFSSTERLPILFTSHGNPMDITLPTYGNPFLSYLGDLGKELRKKYEIKAIMVVSAHWCTRGTFVNVSPFPETIFDYYGFPPEYYAEKLKYHAPGSPDYAKLVADENPEIIATTDWGFDHGNWPMLKNLFPEADLPVFQLSIDYYAEPSYHLELAKKLKKYREKGILIIGSGAIVHNLQYATKRMFAGDTTIYGWDKEFDDYIKKQVDDRNVQAIVDYKKHKLGLMAAPTPDHYVPLIYSMGMIDDKDDIRHTYEGMLPAFSDRSFIAETRK